MIIITKLIKNIHKYLKLGKANVFSVKYGCENCGYEGKLHRHGFYSRNVITKYKVHKISVLRVKCPSCDKTYSLLPPFVIPYYQYSFNLIFYCLYCHYVKNHTYEKIIDNLHTFNPNSFINISNLSFYCNRMNNIASVVNSFFVNYKEFYYEMNNPSIATIIEKIKLFNDKYDNNFNHIYCKEMTNYFFADT